MKVGFIIPAYKNKTQLDKCVEIINTHKSIHDVVCFIHDNSENNLGFTKAVNIGLMEYVDGMTDYCVVINQDCYIEPGFVDEMVDFMEDHPKCFISGPKQVSDKDKDLIIHGGCTTAYPEGRHLIGRESLKSCNENKKMPWVNGACMVVNMSLLPRVGIMDDNYFLIGSDSDWCYTARIRGLEVYYVADAKVIHEQGVSTKRGSKDTEFRKLLDMTYFKDKWIGDGSFRELHMEVFG